MKIPVSFTVQSMAGSAHAWPTNPDLATVGAILTDHAAQITSHAVTLIGRDGSSVDFNSVPGACKATRQVGDLITQMAVQGPDTELTFGASNADFTWRVGDVAAVHVAVTL